MKSSTVIQREKMQKEMDIHKIVDSNIAPKRKIELLKLIASDKITINTYEL